MPFLDPRGKGTAMVCFVVVLLLVLTPVASAQPAFVRIAGGVVALSNVEVIDGTGAPARRDQTIVIDAGRIVAVGASRDVSVPPGAQVLDLAGRTVIPGLVGMHDPLFYVTTRSGPVSAPLTLAHLYLASGVTSIRTLGTIDLEQDIALKREIDGGREVGPKIHLGSPELSDPTAVESAVDRLVGAGVTAFKVSGSLGRAGLEAAIAAAKRHGAKVTGVPCPIAFRDAAAMGIDNLEHGILVDSGVSRQVFEQCPGWDATVTELARTNLSSETIQNTMAELVERGVAVTSTLASLETLTARTAFFDGRAKPFLVSTAWNEYMRQVDERSSNPQPFILWTAAFNVEMAFERDLVLAGGLLISGAPPLGWGGVIPGLANQRNVELLVEAGLSPEQAIRTATANGATFLGEGERTGTVEPGKQADLVVLRGSVASQIGSIRNVELVFKDGVGYDPEALESAEYSSLGTRSWLWWLGVGIAPAIVVLVVVRRISSSRKKAVARKVTQQRRR